mmetsp:Transcript_65225/g.96446  ORF Transcript_65225/g.96446 Transcript_65225/m.96446 type:complete len:486 (+) Transcript_65225:137-1594(+)
MSSNDKDDKKSPPKLSDADAEAAIKELLKRQAVISSSNDGGNNSNAAAASSSTEKQIQAAHLTAVRAQQQQLLQQQKKKGKGGDDQKSHAFWDTQPMPHDRLASTTAPDDSMEQHCPIVPSKPKEELRQEPYNMPKGFEWCEVDILDETERLEVYDLLAQNYVEDDDCMFRFDYSQDFLVWALTPPGFNKSFQLGVRSTKSKRLMAFITGVPAKVRAYEKGVDMVEINFLCVHKKLRSKRLAPVLIKEITRRVNHTGVFQAVYTAGVVLPVPVASCRYYHRSLDPKKLVDIGFSRLHPRMTMARMQKLYRLPTETSTPGLRPMTKEDVPAVHELLSKYLEKFSLSVLFTPEEIGHWILPRKGVINSYVVEAPADEDGGAKKITDLCSFYHLPSTIIGNAKHSTLRAAYSFYNVATSVPLKDLMKDCLTLAKHEENQDVFNALNLMENEQFLTELKFGLGDGNLQYYLYNWSCPVMESKDVGIVLL